MPPTRNININKEDILNSRIFINPAVCWKKNEKGEIMIFLEKRDDFLGKVASLFFLLPKRKIIILDEIGTELFDLILEKNLLIKEVIKYLQEKYILNYIEAYTSTLSYIKRLNNLGIILLEVKKD